jgi:hypothetical protein
MNLGEKPGLKTVIEARIADFAMNISDRRTPRWRPNCGHPSM